jgi:phosphoribosylanthranilate isomerase
MSRGDVDMAVSAGADALGFVTEYPIPVPWNLNRERSAELAASAPPFVTTTAVVGGPVEEMVAIAQAVRPHFLQLHGDESLEMVNEVCERVAGQGIKVIKALRVDVETGRAMFTLPDPVEAAGVLSRSGVAALVMDSKTTTRPAGTGVALDWGMIREVRENIDLPLILAGGLNPENVARAVEMVEPYGVDVISGVERESGIKDGRLMSDFVGAAKGIGTDGRGPRGI